MYNGMRSIIVTNRNKQEDRQTDRQTYIYIHTRHTIAFFFLSTKSTYSLHHDDMIGLFNGIYFECCASVLLSHS